MSPEFPLCAIFVTRIPAAQAGAALEATLCELHRAGQVAWPKIPLPAEAFVEHVAERQASEGASGDALQRLNARDLFLSCACARGVPEAITVFEQEYLSQVPVIARRFDPSPNFADELCQVLRVHLLCGSAERRPRIGEYAGRGTLLAWLRVTTVRTALNQLRPHPGDPAVTDASDMAVALADPGLSPELDLIRGRYQKEFKAAVEHALRSLTSQQRNLLRLQIYANLSSEQIASLYRVNRSTVSRWLSAAREAVMDSTRAMMHERLQVSPEEFASLAGVIHSQLDLSLTNILKEQSVP